MKSKNRKSIAVIVAHPDDETLWAGGTILEHPLNDWFIVCLCRANDCERSARFKNALVLLKAKGIMGNLDDGPDQHPLDETEVENEILKLLPDTHFDLILTHDFAGEYTKHLRHEEVNKAVVALWQKGKITANELWTFAYEDGKKTYFPKAIDYANIFESLSEKIWLRKYSLITKTYGFKEDSWEAETTPLAEAFWQYKSPSHIKTGNAEKENRMEKELNIFKTPNIEILKSLYYKSKSYLLNKSKLETEFNYFEKISTRIIEPIVKKSLDKLEKELRIFKTSSIETLKSSYYESIGIV